MKKISLLVLIVFLSSCASLNKVSYHSPLNGKIRQQPHIRILVDKKIITEPLEKYVAHVLSGEVSPSWPMEALKAQAIAVRSFALRKISERSNQKFDVHSTVLSQVYKKNTQKIFLDAAKETFGMSLSYNGYFAETYFHSTCGGSIASAQSVWGSNVEYLQPKTCGYCHKSPTFSWKAHIPLKELTRGLGFKVSNLKILSYEKDRVKDFLVNGSKKISGQDLRMKVGPMKIKSTKISSLSIDKNNLYMEGNGFGHGVGMCQYGALQMAKEGNNFKDILKFYYPKTKLIKFY